MDDAIACISPSTLLLRLGTARAPLLLDVRREAAFQADQRLLPAALRRLPPDSDDDFAAWIADLRRLGAEHAFPDCEVVVYCVHGHEVSQNIAARLAGAGLRARYLEGGIEGWQAAGAPTVRRLPDVTSPGGRASAWITRERPKIDRIACPWLIRRFIDPLAGFCYVPADRVLSEAAARRAIPFDLPDVRFSHRREQCSFDALLADFDVHDAALDELATMVRGADTGRPELSPQSPGLLALSLGLSALFADDQRLLAQGMLMYDALYSWLKSARHEQHNAALFGDRA